MARRVAVCFSLSTTSIAGFSSRQHKSCSVHFASDPAGERVDVGVDARLVLLTAAVAPAHHTGDVVCSVIRAHQGSTRVALEWSISQKIMF